METVLIWTPVDTSPGNGCKFVVKLSFKQHNKAFDRNYVPRNFAFQIQFQKFNICIPTKVQILETLIFKANNPKFDYFVFSIQDKKLI